MDQYKYIASNRVSASKYATYLRVFAKKDFPINGAVTDNVSTNSPATDLREWIANLSHKRTDIQVRLVR